jgi:hypothetical protein
MRLSFHQGTSPDKRVDLRHPLSLCLQRDNGDTYVIAPVAGATTSDAKIKLTCLGLVATGNGRNIGVFAAIGKQATTNIAALLATGGRGSENIALTASGKDDSRNFGALVSGGARAEDYAILFADGAEGSKNRALAVALGGKDSNNLSFFNLLDRD